MIHSAEGEAIWARLEVAEEVAEALLLEVEVDLDSVVI